VGLALSGFDPKFTAELPPFGILSCEFSCTIGAEVGWDSDVLSKDLQRLMALLLRVRRMETNKVLGCECLGTLVTLQRLGSSEHSVRVELSVQASMPIREMVGTIARSERVHCCSNALLSRCLEGLPGGVDTNSPFPGELLRRCHRVPCLGSNR
jgi:hypothetical protein